MTIRRPPPLPPKDCDGVEHGPHEGWKSTIRKTAYRDSVDHFCPCLECRWVGSHEVARAQRRGGEDVDIVATNAQTLRDPLEQHFAAAHGGAVVLNDVEDPHGR